MTSGMDFNLLVKDRGRHRGAVAEATRYIGGERARAIVAPQSWEDPALPDRLYLDHAATTPMLAAARAAWVEAAAGWANPSSVHAEGRAAKRWLEEARAAIGAAYGWNAAVLLTGGTSEALALALGRSSPGPRLVSAVEHDAVMRAAPDAVVVPVGATGLVDSQELGDMLASTRQALVCLQWANSETGVLQPIPELAEVIHAAGARLLLDAAQMPAGADPAAIAAADFVALSSHKHGGPPGIGALLVRDLADLTPTGGQERGYRAGTENMPAAVGWAAALAEAVPLAEWQQLRAILDDGIRRSGGVVVAEGGRRHPAIGSYRMPGVAAATQLIRFDMAGMAVSAGSACSSGSMKPSHVLAAMGWGAEAGGQVVRMSFGRDTSENDIRRVVAEWRTIARGARNLAA